MLGIEPDQREVRAISTGVTAPGATAAIAPTLFERTAAASLGIEFPIVESGSANYPVLTTNPTAAPKGKGQAAPDTAGAFRLDTRTPMRITGAFQVALEDTAVLPGMEAALRSSLDDVIGQQLDDQVFNGDGSAPQLNGLFQQATNETADTTLETFELGVKRFAALVDGQYADGFADLRAVIGTSTFALYASLFRGNNGDTALQRYLMGILGSMRVSKRMPAVAAMAQKGLVALTRGRQPIRVPIWQNVQLVRDPYTGAGKGEITLTVYLLAGSPHLPYGTSTIKEIHPKIKA